MTAAVRDEVNRAKAMCERYAGEFEDSSSIGSSGTASKRAFHGPVQAVARHPPGSEEVLLPAAAPFYFFPELPQIQFYDRERLPVARRGRGRRPPTFARS